jgi:hypothetical protein
VAAAAMLIVAMLPRVGKRRERVVEDDRAATTTGDGRFARTDGRVDEPVGTTERRV